MKRFLKLLLLGIVLFSSFETNVNAASAYIGVKSSASTVIVGRTFTTTITISSSASLGSWEYTLNYNPTLLKLESGTVYVVDYAANGSVKSKSYTYTFKALASGNATVGVKSYAAYDWNEAKMSLTSGTSTVKLMTQAQLDATYSKNNNLSSLSVEGKTITPVFNKDTLDYTVNLEPNIESINIVANLEDSKATVSGNGVKPVNEGDNKFEIIVTAQNGATKKYTLNAIVKDPNPIEVTTITGEKKVIVKRDSLLKAPEDFIKNTVNINDIIVPSFYNQKNQLVLIGLKDKDSNIALYIYNSIEKKYSPYIELTFDKLRILPLELKKDIKLFANYKEAITKINNTDIQTYKLTEKSEYSIFYGLDIVKGESSYYTYDTKDNNIIRYNNEESLLLNKNLNSKSNLINILTITNILSIALLITSVSMFIIKRKKKPLEKEIKKKLREKKKEKLED